MCRPLVSIDNPAITGFLKQVARHGHAVITYLEGTFLMVCCATTRVVLFIYDLACLPFTWMGAYLGSVLEWATGQPEGGHDDKQPYISALPNNNTGNMLTTDAPDVEKGPRVDPQHMRGPHISTLPPARQEDSTDTPSLTAGVDEVRCCPSSMPEGSAQEQVQPHPAPLARVESSLPLETPELPLRQPGTPVGSTAESTTSDDVDYMPFELVAGEIEEEASIVPSSIDPLSSARPARWSIDYLAHSADGGRGIIVGGGSFAKVGIITHKRSGVKLAVKAISRIGTRGDSLDGFIEMEIRTLQEGCAHPNVVDLLGYVKTTFTAYIMMPMATADLFEVMQGGPLDEKKAQGFMRALVSALEYLHTKGILHRDLKPANVLIAQDDSVLLADFGFAAFIPRGEMFITGPPCGTKSYMSPEQLSGEAEVTVSLKVDMWGLGVVVYELLHGTTPFRPIESFPLEHDLGWEERKGGASFDANRAERQTSRSSDYVENLELSNILTAPVVFDDRLASADCKDFVSKLLERQAANRLSASMAADHPWLGGPEVASEIRTKAMAAAATRDGEMRADRARLMKRTRRVVRRPQP